MEDYTSHDLGLVGKALQQKQQHMAKYQQLLASERNPVDRRLINEILEDEKENLAMLQWAAANSRGQPQLEAQNRNSPRVLVWKPFPQTTLERSV